MVTNYCNCTSISKLNTYLKNFDKTNNINRVIVTDTFLILVLDLKLNIKGPRYKDCLETNVPL